MTGERGMGSEGDQHRRGQYPDGGELSTQSYHPFVPSSRRPANEVNDKPRGGERHERQESEDTHPVSHKARGKFPRGAGSGFGSW